MPYQHAEPFRLQRSRRLAWMLLLAHLISFLALLLWLGKSITLVPIAVIMLLSLWRCLRKPWPVQLRNLPGGEWEIRWSDGRTCQDLLQPRQLTSFVIACAATRSAPILLLSDAFCDADHKKLRVLLRHRVSATAC